MFILTHLRGASSTPPLSEAHRRMYASETEQNFRFATSIFPSSSRTLTSEDLVEKDLQTELADIGQFAEVAHGKLSPKFIWDNLAPLSQPGFPLNGYDALQGSDLIVTFRGAVADLQGYIAHRPNTKQLVIAFSGTSSIAQMFRNFEVRLITYPGGDGCTVHFGFWKMYSDIRSHAMDGLTEALSSHAVDEIVLTGHSLGGVMCYLLALDMMGKGGSDAKISTLDSVPLKLAVFGSPRIGNQALADHWRSAVASLPLPVQEYSVKTYNDGATTIPPTWFGYRHICQTPLYLAGDQMYRVPGTECEFSNFQTGADNSGGVSVKFPRGGHNYYNGRDMEKLQRRMKWFEQHSEVDWKQYGEWLQKVKLEEDGA